MNRVHKSQHNNILVTGEMKEIPMYTQTQLNAQINEALGLYFKMMNYLNVFCPQTENFLIEDGEKALYKASKNPEFRSRIRELKHVEILSASLERLEEMKSSVKEVLEGCKNLALYDDIEYFRDTLQALNQREKEVTEYIDKAKLLKEKLEKLEKELNK